MSHEHDQTNPSSDAAPSGIKLEASPFEPGFQPESIPKISVPDIPEDAVGLTAEALAQVPTLTDQVEAAVEAGDAQGNAEVNAEVNSEVPIEEATVQDTPAQADTGIQQLHARMGKLTDDIQQLNVRLDRLEEKIHIEV